MCCSVSCNTTQMNASSSPLMPKILTVLCVEEFSGTAPSQNPAHLAHAKPWLTRRASRSTTVPPSRLPIFLPSLFKSLPQLQVMHLPSRAFLPHSPMPLLPRSQLRPPLPSPQAEKGHRRMSPSLTVKPPR